MLLSPLRPPEETAAAAVRYESSDEDVIRIEDGRAVIVGAGTATITVTTEQGDYKDTCEVTVHGGSTLSLNKTPSPCP